MFCPRCRQATWKAALTTTCAWQRPRSDGSGRAQGEGQRERRVERDSQEGGDSVGLAELFGFAVGGGIGLLTASIIDVAALSHETAEPPAKRGRRVSPCECARTRIPHLSPPRLPASLCTLSPP